MKDGISILRPLVPKMGNVAIGKVAGRIWCIFPRLSKVFTLHFANAGLYTPSIVSVLMVSGSGDSSPVGLNLVSIGQWSELPILNTFMSTAFKPQSPLRRDCDTIE